MTNWNDHTLYAKWTPSPVAVNFFLNYHSGDILPHAAALGLYDGIVPAVAAPQRAGYTFNGWFNSRTSGKQYFPGTSIIDAIGALDLYANWTPNSYSFAYRSGTVETVANMPNDGSWTYNDQDSANFTVSPLTPTRAGYSFYGWLENSGTIHQPGEQCKSLPGALVFTAQWLEKNIYAVHYDLNGGTSNLSSIPSLTGVKWTQTNLLPATAPSKPGHTFTEWRMDDTSGGGGITVANLMPYSALVANDAVTEVTLRAQWEPNKYDVIYIVTGYNPSFSPDLPSSLLNTAFGASLTVGDEPTLAGYTFSGWTVMDASGTVSAAPGASFTMPDNPVTFMGEFTPIDYRVTYVINGATPPGYSIPESTVYHAGDIVNVDVPPRLRDYRFSGWTYMYNNRLRKAGATLTMPACDLVLEGSFAIRYAQEEGDYAVPLAGGLVGLKNVPVGYSKD